MRTGFSLAAFLALLSAPATSPADTADTLFVAEREDNSPYLVVDPAGNPVLTWIATAPDTNATGRFDELAVATHDSAGWSAPQIVAGPGSYYTPRTVFSSDGARWIVWTEHDGTDSQIRLRRDLGASTQTFTLGDALQPDLEPSIAPDDSGGVVVVWQGWRTDNYEILMSSGGAGGFASETLVSECANSDRDPRVVWGNGKAWIVWSSYQNPAYNLIHKTFDGTTLSAAVQITDSNRARNFHPELAWDDGNGVLWIAATWINRGWVGFNQTELGVLYDPGSPRVWAYDGTTVYQPSGLDADDRFPFKTMQELGYETYLYSGTPMPDRWGPRLAVVPTDGRRVWFLHKQIGPITEFGTVNRYAGVVGLHYGGGVWSAPDAFLDLRSTLAWTVPAAAASGDVLWVAWGADDRSNPISGLGFSMFGHDQNIVVHSVTIDTSDAGPPSLVSLGSPPAVGSCVTDSRPPFQIDVGGTTRTLLFGDNHRHSWDLSWDGFDDPMLFSTLYYSLDFLGHDFISPSDHAERYSKAVWAWIPKYSMLYDVPGRFRVFAGYERSMRGGAGGDQNAFYRDPADFTEASAGYPSIASWHDMYDAMAGIDVLAVPHTPSQCGAEMDWPHLADGDPSVLPEPLRLVEVYQSARRSFEYFGCPRQYTGCVSAADTGWVNVALALGMRIGLLGASDHTIRAGFISVFAEDRSRDAIWQALYDRHCFGSSRYTKFNCDFRVNGALMGSEIESGVAPTLDVLIEGPNPLLNIDINKDGNPTWFSTSSADSDTTFSIVDPDPVIPGTSSFYYLRVLDANNRMLWTSSVWVDFGDPTGVQVAEAEGGPLRVAALPNPSRRGDIRFEIGGLSPVGGRLNLYDVGGRLVRRLDLEAGSPDRIVPWDGRDAAGSTVAPGVYFAVLQSRGETQTVRFVRLR